MPNSIILFTTLYSKAKEDTHRFWELKTCLNINLANEHITEIVIFFERETETFDTFKEERFDFLSHKKIKLHFITKRPTLKEFFEYANLHYSNQHIVVCNSDIFFYKDSNIERLKDLKSHRELWVLTRYYYNEILEKWVVHPFGHKCLKAIDGDEEHISFKNWETVTNVEEYNKLSESLPQDHINLSRGVTWGTFDTYCFYAPLRKIDFDIFIGAGGCDTYLVLKCLQKSIRVLNPAFSIISRHLHRSLERNHSLSYKQESDYQIAHYINYNICNLEQKNYIRISLIYYITKMLKKLNLYNIARKLKKTNFIFKKLKVFDLGNIFFQKRL